MARVIGLPRVSAGGVRSSFTVLGIPQAIAKLELVDARARFLLGGLTYRFAQKMTSGAKENINSESGNLASGVKMEKGPGPYIWLVTASSRDGNVAGKNDYEYADFVENGTSKMPGQFFMRRAYQTARVGLEAELRIMAAEIQRI